jgi:hypothetical protein
VAEKAFSPDSPVISLQKCSDQTDGGTFYCKDAKEQRGKEKRLPPASLHLCSENCHLTLILTNTISLQKRAKSPAEAQRNSGEKICVTLCLFDLTYTKILLGLYNSK